MKILIVEDNAETAQYIAKILRQKNFTFEILSNGYEALYAIKSSKYDLILLDIDLPYITGLDLLTRIRKLNITTPTIGVSGLSSISDKIGFLNAGADDYLTKPFDSRELIARIEVVNRRNRHFDTTTVKFGNILIDQEVQSVSTEDGKYIHLTKKEYIILELLIHRKPSVISKEVFLSHLYNNICDEPNSKIVDVFVCKLRKKLINAAGDLDSTPRIKTVWGRGYMIHLEKTEGTLVEDSGYDSYSTRVPGSEVGDDQSDSELEINIKQA